MKLCTALLAALQAHGEAWCPPLRLVATPSEEMQPSPSSATQAVLQLLARLTRRHANAAAAASAGVPRLLLRLPSACLLPNASRHEPHMLTILRHVLEDPATLSGWMEAEIRNFFVQRARGAPGLYATPHRAQARNDTPAPLSSFLSSTSRLLNRDPYVFLDVLSRCCTLDAGSPIIRLKRTDQQQAQPAPPGQPAQAAGAAAAAGEQPRRSSHEGGPTAMDLTPASPGTAAVGAAAPAAAGGAAAAADGSRTPAPPGAGAAASVGAGAGAGPVVPPTLAKVIRKSVPASFVDVIDALVDVIMSYKGQRPVTPPAPAAKPAAAAAATAGGESMDVDVTTPPPVAAAAAGDDAAPSAAAAAGGADPAAPSAQSSAARQAALEAQLQSLLRQSSEVVMQRLALRFLTEFSLLFSPTVGLLLKRDEQLTGAVAAAVAAAAADAAATPSAGDAVAKAAEGKGHKGESHDDTHAPRDKEKEKDKEKDKEHGFKTPHASGRRASAAATGGKHGHGHGHAETGKKGAAAAAAAAAAQQHPPQTPHPAADAQAAAQPHAQPHRAGALLRQLIHVHLVTGEPGVGGGSGGAVSLTDKVNELLQAICVRSVEGRRRIIGELVATLAVSQLAPGALDPAHRELILRPPPGAAPGAAGPYEERPGYASPAKVRAMVQLVGALVEGSGAGGSSDPRRPGGAGGAAGGAGAVSTEILRTMREHGMVRALTVALQAINPDHPRAAVTAAAILRPLELLTRHAGAWAPKLAAGGLGGPLAAGGGGGGAGGAGARAGPGSARRPDGAAAGDAAMDDEARAEAGPAALRAMGRRGRADPMVDMLIGRIDQAMEELGADVGSTSDEEDDGGDHDEPHGGRRRRRHHREGGDDDDDDLEDLDDMDEDDEDEDEEDEEGEEDEDEEGADGEGELADEMQMQRLQDEMSEDAEAEEEFGEGEEDEDGIRIVLGGPHGEEDEEDIDLGEMDDDDEEDDEDDEGEHGDHGEHGAGEGEADDEGAEELVEEEEEDGDEDDDEDDGHDPFDAEMPEMRRGGARIQLGGMADGLANGDADADGGPRGDEDEEEDEEEDEVEEEEEGSEHDYEEEEYAVVGDDGGGGGAPGRMFMDGPPGLLPMFATRRTAAGTTFTAQFDVPADLEDMVVDDEAALAELINADWGGGGAGRRNRTFRYGAGGHAQGLALAGLGGWVAGGGLWPRRMHFLWRRCRLPAA
ncbi:hypothetical protein GPECTOR_790g10 [Gonium pectorale]|uniref:E3 ubiquitin-protein ligase n=1 Tax=Gonium pectorale TaxID=33097 RepID=A0A150FU55_GONPE|nr:hypothetical protein GPECTOR_790g10 [Gonium pectorale]|eukprot:KXZ41108.1 hypothetical protein GPECTOR_790g10 [Gonium pectorale]